MNRSASGLPSQHTSFNENALIVGTPEEAIDSASALAAWCTPRWPCPKRRGHGIGPIESTSCGADVARED